MHASVTTSVRKMLGENPLRASQLIVSIYGDIVEPRSGVLWMGNLIALCAGFDVNESLVRTAVSRLVTKGQIMGRRQGRRSFYALTPAASAQYHEASDVFFGPLDDECRWILCHCPTPPEQLQLTQNGYAALGGDMFLAANRPERKCFGVAFDASAVASTQQDLKKLAWSAFDLARLSESYSGFVERLRTLPVTAKDVSDGEEAVTLRLALIHAYRTIRFTDPRLPPSALPGDWSGHEAHKLFADAYCSLSSPADAYIGENLLDDTGKLARSTQSIDERLNSLSTRLQTRQAS